MESDLFFSLTIRFAFKKSLWLYEQIGESKNGYEESRISEAVGVAHTGMWWQSVDPCLLSELSNHLLGDEKTRCTST